MMSRGLRAIALFAGCLMLFLAPARLAVADTLYGATGSNGVGGELFILDPTTGGAIQDVGALIDSDSNAYGLTGLAFQPGTGMLFGTTSNASPTAAGHLVMIDPTTALVTDIGSYLVTSTMADITFDPTSGTLYGWQSGDGHGLYTIDPTTGEATLVGGTTSDFGGGGLAASPGGTLYNTPDGVTGSPGGHLVTVNKTTGDPTVVGLLSGGPTPQIINAMDFDRSGMLFGVQTDRGSPTSTHLVLINTSTAGLTDIGPSVSNLDGIAFQQSVPEPSSLALLAAGAAGLVIIARRHRRGSAAGV